MASPTYVAHALVLRKTKLGEADLICSLLCEDGSQKRVVAKGARKPSSPFASRLDLACEVEVLCAEGRNLDIVKEARLVDGRPSLRESLERSSGAACMCELLDRITQDGLEEDKLFAMTRVALDELACVDSENIPLVVAGHLLKAHAFAGFRPSLAWCAVCAEHVDLMSARGMVAMSLSEGGVVCKTCESAADAISIRRDVCVCMNRLINSPFSDIRTFACDARTQVEVLQFCQMWTRQHVGSRLKSLEFFLTTGIS